MEEEFVIYNQALALKELGFDEPCFAGYRHSKWIGSDGPNSRYFHAQLFSNHQFDDDQKEYCSAPLKQQVFRWFRNKYKYSSEIKTPDGIDGKWRNTVHKIYGFGNYSNDDNEYNSYEEAEGAAIDTLIKLVKDDLERSN